MDKINFKNSKLLIEGTVEERKEKSKAIGDLIEALKPDRNKRRSLYKKRLNFYIGNHDYTNIVGKTVLEKKGHPNAVFNYAGKTAKKITYGLANNPPTVTIPARSMVPKDFRAEEALRAQGVQEFIVDILKKNKFWLNAYRRSCLNQVVMGDAAIKCYPFNDEGWEIKITALDKMDNIMVAWRGDDTHEFDEVVVEEERTLKSIEDEFGIKIPEKMAHTTKSDDKTKENDSQWADDRQWEGSGGLPSGETKTPKVTLVEYDSKDYYCLLVGSHVIQYVIKDGITYPKVSFWTIVNNIPQPRSPWSISDIDDMMDPQIEFNEASNDERSYIRVGVNQRYLAINMEDFDPESIKASGSGGVIFVDSPDGSADFRPLNTNTNSFPADSYLNRVRDTMYDMGVPKVTFGAGGADSGRSKAIDYQSLVELIDYKHDAWELALMEIFEKIQLYGDFYFGKKEDEDGVEIFKDPTTEKFVVRHPDFDWEQVMPITASDKIVNVLNKVQMGLPFRIAYKELGYTDVEGVIDEMKKESKDPELMEFRSKMYQVAPGLVEAQKRAQELLQAQEAPPPASVPGTPSINTPSPTLVSSQNEGAQPVAAKGGTSFSSPRGFIESTRQNLNAAGA